MSDCIHSWDDRRNIALPGDEKQTLEFCVEHFIDAYKEAIEKSNSFSVALSGGSTPKAIFSMLTKPPYVSQIEWKKVHLFWSDERSVDPTDPESNYRMAMEAGFKTVGIPQSQIHRMKSEFDIEENAKRYEELLYDNLKNKGFDYLMLGMGEDGHTASLFPGTKALEITDQLVVANIVPQKNTSRMTLTFPCINSSSNIVLYVLGEKKQELLKEIYSHKKPRYPVEEVGTELHQALWIADDAAARLLSL
jgi:6-phosphogluconolactonase